ncbi:two-component sensor histidine kinase [Geomonas sp. Red276]
MPRRNRVPEKPGRNWSIARRLAILHIAAVCISYILFGLVFYGARANQLRNADHKIFRQELSGITHMLREPNAVELVGEELRSQLYEPDDVHPLLRFLDREGRVIRESPSMATRLPGSAFASLPRDNSITLWKNRDGDYFQLAVIPLEDNPLTGKGGVLQVGVSAREQRTMGVTLRYSMIAFIGWGLLFAFICSHFIVWLGLKPLEDISQTALSITKRELHTRIDHSTLPVELVSLAESFNSMLARLEESFARLSHYSGNLAHELRTPINTLMMAADIALSRERSAEEYRAALAASLEEFGRLSSIIDRMLFLARADIEKQDLFLQRLEVASEIENLFDYYLDAAEEAGIELTTTGNATILADQTLIRRAISNLIRNSLAHTPEGGNVSVSVRQGAQLTTEITVADTGCGIDPVHLPHIFDRFYRVQNDHEKVREGTGLGLAIVKAIMQMHLGSVEIESEPGVGTRVTLSFPPAENGK